MSYRKIVGAALLAVLALWPAADVAARAPSTQLHLQESANRDVGQKALVASVQADAEAATPGDAQAAVNGDMAAAVELAQAESSVGAATGTVKWFNPTKGYGFIQPDDGSKDVFVHISAVERAGLDSLREGQKVEYELVAGRDGRSSAENLVAHD